MFSNKLFNSSSLSCCLFFVTTLRATAVYFLRLVVAPLQFTSHLIFLFIAATGCPDVDLEVLATAGCPVVGREMLATGFPNDCFLLIVMSLMMSSLLSSPAGLLAPADLSSSAEHDVVTNDIIIDGPLRCSSWFPFDVPAGSSSSSSACSWFISFQLIHFAPAGSTWPLPDYEQLTQLWTSPLLIQLPITMNNQTSC
ncbi:putative beta-1,3-galactosyltransferase 20 [Dorcoceras hygrometricum]|uniref:Putative beta-1,3-galactosyltransferase 20 n=1 Tax=Dorcoceras hygrometricum TaxID=472368 RepID=A0A2Z7BR45_9LAMI|nr:putative beta-1,3-galactosyltransferase 20 [Dorcoceras hygrometricum]